MKIRIEESGLRLREIGRIYGIPGAAAMEPRKLRDEIERVYRRQVATEERLAKVRRIAALRREWA